MKKIINIVYLLALLFPVTVFAQGDVSVPKASALDVTGKTPQYFYNVEAKGFLVGANEWGTRASIDSTKGYICRFEKNGSTYQLADQYGGYWHALDYDGDGNIWVDGEGRNGSGLWTFNVNADGSFTISSTYTSGLLSIVPSKGDTRLYMSTVNDAQSTWIAVSKDDYFKYRGGIMLGLAEDRLDENIVFADDAVKALCVAHWDTNGDGELSVAEAVVVTDIGNVFEGNLVITSFNELQYFVGLDQINVCAFCGCRNLSSVIIPKNVSLIGNHAFFATGLTEITIPSSVRNVDYNAFAFCDNLKRAVFEEGTTSVGGNSFAECPILEEVLFPSTLNYVGMNMFGNCPNLKHVVMPIDAPICRHAELCSGGDLKHSVLFTIPEGAAKNYLQYGYYNISDKSELEWMRQEFENEAARVTDLLTDEGITASKDAQTTLTKALSSAWTAVGSADSYLAIGAQIDVVKSAAKTFLSKATIASETDITAIVRNPQFERMDFGWDVVARNAWQGSRCGYQNIDEYHEQINGKVKMYDFLEVWWNEVTLEDGRLSQTIIDLPTGVYRLEADVIAAWEVDENVEVTGVSLFMGDSTIAVATGNKKPKHFVVRFDNFATRDITIGIKWAGTTANWVAVDNFRLIYEGSDHYLEDLIATASAETPVDLTFFIQNANFDQGNKDGWSITEDIGQHLQYQYDVGVDYSLPNGTAIHGYYNETTGSWIQRFIEAWLPTPGTLGNGTISQIVKGLPDGLYSLSCDVIACNQDMEKQETVGVYLFAECGGVTFQQSVSTNNERPELFNLRFQSQGGIVTLGLMSKNAIANWMAADNFRLYYLGQGSYTPICATPQISSDGTSNRVTITCATEGATIYYTTDSSTPTSSSAKYSGPVSLSADCTVKAMAVKSGYTDSEVATYNFTFYEVACKTPELQRDGSFNRVSMTCATEGATIYYTRNGTTPTQNSLRYSSPIAVAYNCTIKAIAVKNGYENSEVATFDVDWFQVATPIFNLENLQLTISTKTSSATIYYTTDGSTPTTSSAQYNGPITLSKDCTVKAIAVKENFNNSEVAIFNFKMNDVICQAPQIQRDETGTSIIMASATAGASIYYTTNGTTPTENNTRYTGPITVSGNCIIKAIAVKDGYTNSSVSTYSVDWFKVVTPIFSYENLQLSISTATEYATIYYTTNGTTPTTSSTKYTGPLSLTKNTTVKAIAVKDDWIDSDVATYNFVVDDYTCQVPQVTRDGTSNRVIITCETFGASIYYTTDNSSPKTSSTQYSSPITVDRNMTIRAIAVKDGMFNSAQSRFTVDWFKVATPTFSYNNLQLTIRTATSDARIYYTTDGSNPLDDLLSAIRYTTPIHLEENVVVKAAAVKGNYNSSEVASYTFVKSSYTCKQPRIQRDGTTDRLAMSSTTSDAIIYYTTDGSVPTTSSIRYTGPVTMTYNCTVRAIATRSDLFPSDESMFTVDWLSVSAATLAYNNGTLTISYPIQGAEIHYEIGDKDATKSSPLYTGPITLTDNREVKYVVYVSGMEPVSGSFTPTDFTCAPVTINYDGLNIELSTTETDATIYYTLDGSLPTPSSAIYTGKTPLTDLCTVNAIAVKEYKKNSEVMQKPITYFFDGSTVRLSESGRIEDALKWRGTDNLESLSIQCQGQGVVSYDDMSFLRTIKGLKHLNLKDARFVNNTVPNGAFAGMNIVSVEFSSSNITTLGNVFSGCQHLAAIIWNAQVPMASTAQAVGISNPNLLLYVDSKVFAPQGVRNVIANGTAGNIILTDEEEGGSYYCPQAFHAQSISYSHIYTQTTGINKECRGWETIALPFDVQTITHEAYGLIAPFAANVETARPFWLAELNSNGFRRAVEIKAYTPYIISMPNNDVYGSSYILKGKVTFEAVNTTVPVTEIKTTSKGTHVFTPCFDEVEAATTVYALNKNDQNTYFAEGSTFIPSYREVKPFEAYINVPSNGVSPRYIPIRDDSDTGIDYLTPDPFQNERVYDLTGRKVQGELKRGVYIINGNKVMVK